MTKEKISLDLDLDSLLPGDTIRIGKTDVLIRPLNFRQYKQIITQLRVLVSTLNEKSIDISKIEDPNSILLISEVLITEFPQMLEEASGIEMESLEQLPIETILELTTKIIEVNLKSKDSFLGNFERLSEMINNLFPEKVEKKQVKKVQKRAKA